MLSWFVSKEVQLWQFGLDRLGKFPNCDLNSGVLWAAVDPDNCLI